MVSGMIKPILGILAAAVLPTVILAFGCPFHFGSQDVFPGDLHHQRSLLHYDQALAAAVDFKAVKEDLKMLLKTSKPWWPADWGNYGPLMIRLAWHCNGSYRTWDGRGGCEGARQRFDPERSWPDNTNLDKARKLLVPLKLKYGNALSWGDLIVLAGDVAIESMGGPILGFCGGRIDDVDGSASLALGPTPVQEEVAPCTLGDGNCEQPLGQSTMGLIYVNPEGVMGKPEPEKSVEHIRSTFKRMGMDDEETVALIGGGHAFGKVHGACPTGAGPGPDKDPANPWPGTCGSGPTKGKGPNTFTSGFEGPWTLTPTQWNNEYFNNLLKFDWESWKGPGGHFQWRPKPKPGSRMAAEDVPNIIMLTTDVALLKDPIYLGLVKRYAADQSVVDDVFKKAWYKLMTRDRGPITRCLGELVAPPQPFQNVLPAPATPLPDFSAVQAGIKAALTSTSTVIPGDSLDGKAGSYYGALFSTLAWQCASTFRQTDYAGGCNGARIRFSPQRDWPKNQGLDKVLQVLQPIQDKYPTLSYADLIVLAGTTALEEASAGAGPTSTSQYKFCGGRVDAEDGGYGTSNLAPRKYVNGDMVGVRDTFEVMGLTPEEGVALSGRLRSPSQQQRLGFSGSWTANPGKLSNEYFKVLLEDDWQRVTSAAGKEEYKAVGKELYMTPQDLVLKLDPEFASIALEYASDNNLFLKAFAAAWTKVMNADRFKGPAGNECDAPKPSVQAAAVS